MPIAVAVAEDADFPRLVQIASLAFNTNEPFFDVVCPEHSTTEGQQSNAARWIQGRNADPTVVFLKAYDTASGEIVGLAKWFVLEGVVPSPPTLDPAAFGGEAEAQLRTQLLRTFLVPRNEAIQRNAGKLVSLDCLAVDPAHQRRGVGAALVRWGTEKADALGYEAVVESSVFGKALYEKNGFVFVKDVKLTWPEPVQARPMKGYAWLVRPKTAASS